MAYSIMRDESKSELAQDLDDRLQSQNVPFGTSDDLCNKEGEQYETGQIFKGIPADQEKNCG